MSRTQWPAGYGARRRRSIAGILAAVLFAAGTVDGPRTPAPGPPDLSLQSVPYFPGPGDVWERRAAVEAGFEPDALQEAVAYALDHESDFGPDLEASLRQRLNGEPYSAILGPMKDRGGTNGLVLRSGYIVAEWGDTRRVDMTFSVTKSFLSTLAGVALRRGLIQDLHDPVREYVLAERFESDQNAPITWHHLLRQTSEWEGTLWGKPDVADRRRGRDRELRPPGTFWEYNDVRVNLTALALLRLFREPLPRVLSESVMVPIGATSTWRWHGYRNSYVAIDGRHIQSVSGGGHWGGGLWISSRDLARFGLLHLRDGEWADARILPEGWVSRVRTPSEANPSYGYLWWLNTDRAMWPSVPASSFAALGGGTNAVWIDPDHRLVVVVRWIDREALGPFLGRVLGALTGEER